LRFNTKSNFFSGNGNGLLFHMTQPTSRSTIKPSCAVNQPLAKIRANENTTAQ